MQQARQRGRGEAETRHRAARHVVETARGDGIASPDEGRRKGQPIAGGQRRKASAPADKQHHQPRKAGQRAQHVARPQALARQQGGKQHDEQRPEIIHKPRFRRRCRAQGREIERVVAKKPARPQSPGGGPLAQDACLTAPEQHEEARQAACRKGDGCQLERRHGAGGCRQHCKHGPQQDGAEPRQGRGVAGAQPAQSLQRPVISTTWRCATKPASCASRASPASISGEVASVTRPQVSQIRKATGAERPCAWAQAMKALREASRCTSPFSSRKSSAR